MWKLKLASMTYGDISCCLAMERARARVDIRSKYPEKHSVTLIKNEYFCARALALPFLRLVTSMFVERMEVLEYRQKFEVEPSTFPDSTNTEYTSIKLVFSLTCVCVCMYLSVSRSVRKSVSYEQSWISYEEVDRFE